MQCRYCHKSIQYNSVYCNWCGGRQIVDRTSVSVPRPRKLKSGYTAQLMVNGVRVRVTEATEEEYYEKARALKQGKIKPDATITLRDAIDKYVESRSESLDVRTKDTYEFIKLNRFKSLMPMQVCDITSDALELAKNNELKQRSRKGGTLSPKTVNDALGLVKAAIKFTTGTVPTVSNAKEKKKLHDYPTVEEVVDAVIGTDIELPCLLALWLGLSMEEIRGLTKSKSIVNTHLRVVEKVVDVKGKATRLQGGKEYNRVRQLDIPEYIQALINRVDGDIIEPRTGHAIYMRLQVELKRHNVKPCSFHDLRHLNTATMTSANIPSKTIQARNGWATDRMIKEVYDYVYDSDRQSADKYMDNYFNSLIKK